MGFWDTLAGQITAWSAALAGIAAGAKGLGYLIRKGVIGFRIIGRAAKAVSRLAAIGDAEKWPNGSTDLPTFLHAVHKMQGELHEWMRDHKAHHIDIEARIR